MGGPVTIGLIGVALLLAACGGDVPDAGVDDGAPTPGDVFDRERSEQDARALLGLPEDEVEADALTRIVRRGDEDFVVTMDLIPGRRNVELDDDGTGAYVVTRVVVEVPDGEDPLVVE